VKEVCGDDGKTYNNQCLAGCAEVKVAGEGPCKATAASKPSKCMSEIAACTCMHFGDWHFWHGR
jgi:hypothetical protein